MKVNKKVCTACLSAVMFFSMMSSALATETDSNSAVIINSYGLNGISSVFVGKLSDGEIGLPGESLTVNVDMEMAKVLGSTDVGISIEMPNNISDGIYKISANEQEFIINKPEIKWTNSLAGTNTAVIGEKIYINGKNFLGSGNAKICFVDSNGNKTLSEVVASDNNYMVEVITPKTLEEGNYKLYLHNGFGGVAGWSDELSIIVSKQEKWNERIFNIEDFGAAGEDLMDDTFAFRCALAAAGDNGGGIVYVPRGRWIVSNYLVIPEFVTIRGMGDNSQVIYSTLAFDRGEVPETFFYGEGNFALEDFYVWGNRVRSFLITPENCKGNIRISGMNVKFSKAGGAHLDETEFGWGSAQNEWLVIPGYDFYSIEPDSVGVRGMKLYGDNIHITNNMFYFQADSLKLLNSQGHVIKDNVFRNFNPDGFSNDYLVNVKNTIYSNNEINTQLKIQNTDGYKTHNINIINNYLPANYCATRECVIITGGNSESICISKNRFENCGAALVENNCKNIILDDNQFIRSKGIEIELPAGSNASDIEITSNSFEACLYTGVYGDYAHNTDGMIGGIEINTQGNVQNLSVSSNIIKDNGRIKFNSNNGGKITNMLGSKNLINYADNGILVNSDNGVFETAVLYNNKFTEVTNCIVSNTEITNIEQEGY